MSEKAERRQLKQQIGETAAGAMAECRDEVLKVRATGLQLLDAVQGCDERTKATAQRVDAALKLGFDLEKGIAAERRERLGLEGRLMVGFQEVQKYTAGARDLYGRGLLGRLKWLVVGR